MVARADFEHSDGADGAEVRFTGRLTLARLGDVPARLDALGAIATLDLSAIDRIDTVGAWIVTRSQTCGSKRSLSQTTTRDSLLFAAASRASL